MNSPYTKHLDALDAQSASTALTVPTYAPAPMQMHAPAPMIVPSGDTGGGKAGLIIVAILAVIVAAAGGWAMRSVSVPSWNELRRFEALAGREGEIRGRDAGWNQGRKQGRTEMQSLAQYERLKTQAGAFNQGYVQGRNIGRQMGADQYRYRYSRYGGYGYGRGYRGYGYGYGGRVGSAIATAQTMANMTGNPVDVTVG